MTQENTDSGGAAIVFDDWRTILFAVFLALVGYSVMVTVPVLSTGLARGDPDCVGWLGSPRRADVVDFHTS